MLGRVNVTSYQARHTDNLEIGCSKRKTIFETKLYRHTCSTWEKFKNKYHAASWNFKATYTFRALCVSHQKDSCVTYIVLEDGSYYWNSLNILTQAYFSSSHFSEITYKLIVTANSLKQIIAGLWAINIHFGWLSNAKLVSKRNANKGQIFLRSSKYDEVCKGQKWN